MLTISRVSFIYFRGTPGRMLMPFPSVRQVPKHVSIRSLIHTDVLALPLKNRSRIQPQPLAAVLISPQSVEIEGL
jgi:hypothetical protein